ncbi:ATP-dependent RecD-like DNA helicase [Fibrobacter sp. UWEL]|uniref:ATP-dependent DNA helicase n=1 Tax=Fibrobacter sp. UWEL TaxID=1896209 RepID=UPI00090FC07D|nr:AAA family ATPase [Fibrobacter sp. UWEL]SHK73120.1 DNA helicase/exodeoxyribonuclease V, alpha subunit [Fibrobacter sp. UWEL]
MTKDIITNGSVSQFFDLLREARGIAAINAHLQKFVQDLQPDISADAQKYLLMLLSLQEEGNTRFSLDPEIFYKKWETKWNGLMLSIDAAEMPSASDFKSVVEKGIVDIRQNKYTNIIDWNGTTKLFVVKENFIFATKYYKAKVAIENAATTHFTDGKNFPEADVKKCTQKVATLHKKNPRFTNEENPQGEFRINEEQAQAILRGQKENLIITGGPGTGKTTVVLYILWNLLENNPQYLEDWEIKLAAPSGKAADRMRESIAGGLADINDEFKNSPIFKKLEGLESYTIHRLLKYLPKTGKFYYNSETQFSERTIFVIDEASMIDISLFAALLQAIAAGSRIFILGDPFQLPSVEAGAVLGEILSHQNRSRNFVVKLLKSNRFTDDSNIGQLAHAIQARAEGSETGPVSFLEIQEKVREAARHKNRTEPKDKILLKSLDGMGGLFEEQVQNLVCETLEPFSILPELAEQIIPDASLLNEQQRDEQNSIREKLWNLTLSLRLLSAERRGTCGVENLNKVACKKIRGHWINYCRRFAPDFVPPRSRYFPGQLLILTQNQAMYKLYNGDTGVVIFHEERPYLMLKKDDFVFYPLSLLPEDSLEPAFAITIHKSQGSEYKHVTMFLPKQKGHPLLTNQILYTGITRAKEEVVIIATPEAFDDACCTVTERETGIIMM